MDFGGKKVLVIGTGISGVAACELLHKNGVSFVLNDSNEKLDIDALRGKSNALIDADIRLGNITDFSEFSYAVLSPGVPTDIPMVNAMRDAGITISGEIELAYCFSKGDVIAITGTNGKTTTTTLVGEIMKAYRADSRVVGNIGIPYTASVDNMTIDTVTVAEISSFQLETIQTFAPKVTAILNITPDHLNRHHTMEAYIKAKEDITKFQSKDNGDSCILNYEDEVLRAFGESVKDRVNVIFFSSKNKLDNGLYLEDGVIYSSIGGEIRRIIGVKEQNLLGEHNYENIMAAVAMTMCYGVDLDIIIEVLKRFNAVEHRIEFVREIDGVRYYNDSKGTNPDASIKAVLAMEGPTLLIGGGYDKASDFDEWVETFAGRVKHIVLIGVTASKIATSCEKLGFTNYSFARTFDEAIDSCREMAVSGDNVLLSPACASWDMFKSYEQRGTLFKNRVNSYK